MRVKLRTILAGPGISGQPGEVIDVDDERGRGLVAGGYATLVPTTPPPPSREGAPPENEGTPPENEGTPPENDSVPPEMETAESSEAESREKAVVHRHYYRADGICACGATKGASN